jgi:hypothetical protein
MGEIMQKRTEKKPPPFFIINIGTKEIPVLKYIYEKEE